ncbi:secretion related GTPase [Niveomyces insectorum RCEF 264]|uniref:Secretion related GTPase n=1 Tax=Niveomyces insectorum RCEF 264 TaxID=1081102 RepID=A0A167ZTI9_9HYPO|nr:secretion related GTPase [Niveomyces insectorum RCEF 264]
MSSSPPPPWDYIAKLVCIGDSGCGKSSLTIRLCEGRFVAHHDVTIGVEFGSRVVPVGPPYSTASRVGGTAAPLPLSQQEEEEDQQQPQQRQQPIDASSSGLPDPPRVPATTPAQRQKHMKLSLWDTAGQETYKSVTRSYFRGASGALLVFDLARKPTFLHVQAWLDDLRQIADPDIVVVLVGNKADLVGEDDDGDGGVDNVDGGRGQKDTHDNTANGNTTNGTNGTTTNTNGKTTASPPARQVTRAEAEAWARRNGVLAYVETSAKSGANVEQAFLRVAERIYENVQAGRYDLHDRRSGVKGPGAAAAAVHPARRHDERGVRAVLLMLSIYCM